MNSSYCVLVPVRNGASWLPEFLFTLQRYQPQPLRTYFFLNNCTDLSEEIIKKHSKTHGRVTMIKKDYQDSYFDPLNDRFNYVTHLCRVRNTLIDTATEHNKDWTHALLHDLTKISTPELPKKLLEASKPVVAPLVLKDGICAFWDLANFKDLYGDRFAAAPPFFTGPMLTEVSSVGSVCMIEREVFRCGRFAPSKDEMDGTFVNFCNIIRLAGASCWVRRDVFVVSPTPR